MLHYGYSLQELENMIPWEKDIYIYFVEQHVKEQNDQMKQSQSDVGEQRITP